MKRSRLLKKMLATGIAAAMCVGMLGGCAGSGAGDQQPETSADTESMADTQEPETTADTEGVAENTEYGIKYAQMFDIEYMENDIKLLTDAQGNQKLLVPKDVEVPEGFDEAMVIRTPVENVLYYSTAQVSAIEELGIESLFDSIAAVATPIEGWLIPQVIERMESGQIEYLVNTESDPGNIEQIAEMNPDLVMLASSEIALQLADQLDMLSIPYVVEFMGQEVTDEALVEWIKFVAAFYNEDQTANDVFEASISAMEELKASIAQIPDEEKPVVAYGLYYGGTVYTVTADSRIAQTIEAAGGIYALSDLEGEGSVQISFEEFIDKAREADILIYSSLIDYLSDKNALLTDATSGDPLMAEFAAYQNDTIYVYNTDFYAASVDADEKFEDYVAIIHPELMEGYELQHFVKLPD